MVNGGHRNSVEENCSADSVEEISSIQKDVYYGYFWEHSRKNSICRTSVRIFIVAGNNLQQRSFDRQFSELNSLLFVSMIHYLLILERRNNFITSRNRASLLQRLVWSSMHLNWSALLHACAVAFVCMRMWLDFMLHAQISGQAGYYNKADPDSNTKGA